VLHPVHARTAVTRMSEDGGGWEDYESVQMFEGCDCGHDATEHKGAWGDWREGDGCLVPGCPCDVEWEHA
jgi:hypothetical protein